MCTNLTKRSGTALTEACYLGDMSIVQLLLDKGADVNCSDGWALQTAAAEGHDLVIEELLRRGANINVSTTNENFPAGTALQAACEAGKLDIVELLLKHNADPDLGAGPQTCPLIAASQKGEDKIVELLVNANAKVNVFGGSETGTPLTLGAAYLQKESLELLLKAGAGIDLREADGDTALIVAARRGDKDCVQFLLDEGADIMILNNDGENAIQAALANIDSEDVGCLTILVNRVSTILGAIKTAMDSGDVSITSAVRRVDIQKPTIQDSENERRVSNASFVANDDQIHFNAGGPHSRRHGWNGDDRDAQSMKIPAKMQENFSTGLEDTSIIPASLYPEQPNQAYTYPEQNDTQPRFTEPGFEGFPEGLSSNSTPYRPTQTEDPSNDPTQQFRQMKIKRKPSPGTPLPGQSPQTSPPLPSEYLAYQQEVPPLPPKQNVSSLPPRSSLPTQSTYPRTNPSTTQYPNPSYPYQPPPWTSDQGPYPTTPPSQNRPQYQTLSPEQQLSQRAYAHYNPQSYPERPTGGYPSPGSGLTPNALQGGYRAFGWRGNGDGYRAYEGEGYGDGYVERVTEVENR